MQSMNAERWLQREVLYEIAMSIGVELDEGSVRNLVCSEISACAGPE